MPLSTGKYYNLEKTPYHRVMSKFRYNFQCPFFKIIKSYIHCKYRYNKPHPCNLKPRLGLPVLGTLPWAPRPTCTYWSSVVTTDCPVDPQSELGPEILAQATYQELAWMGIGSSNSIAYFSLEQNQWKFAWFIEMYMYNEINPFCKIRIFFTIIFFLWWNLLHFKNSFFLIEWAFGRHFQRTTECTSTWLHIQMPLHLSLQSALHLLHYPHHQGPGQTTGNHWPLFNIS